MNSMGASKAMKWLEQGLLAEEAALAHVALANFSQSQLAEALGVTEARVSQVLDAESNLTVRAMARMSHAMGHRFEVQFVPEASASEAPDCECCCCMDEAPAATQIRTDGTVPCARLVYDIKARGLMSSAAASKFRIYQPPEYVCSWCGGERANAKSWWCSRACAWASDNERGLRYAGIVRGEE